MMAQALWLLAQLSLDLTPEWPYPQDVFDFCFGPNEW